MRFGTGKFDLASGTSSLGKKSLFFGLVETYFAGYDSVVLTGPRGTPRELKGVPVNICVPKEFLRLLDQPVFFLCLLFFVSVRVGSTILSSY